MLASRRAEQLRWARMGGGGGEDNVRTPDSERVLGHCWRAGKAEAVRWEGRSGAGARAG